MLLWGVSLLWGEAMLLWGEAMLLWGVNVALGS